MKNLTQTKINMILCLIMTLITGIILASPACEFLRFNTVISGITLLIGFLIYAFIRLRKDKSEAVWYELILIFGLLLRTWYLIAVPFDFSRHDLGDFSNDGHLGYMGYVSQNLHLPDFDPRSRWSFYNPPLYYIISGLILRIFPDCFELLKITNYLSASVTVVLMTELIKKFKMSSSVCLVMTAFLSLHPFFNITAATLTNDALAMCLSMISLYCLYRWHHSKSTGDIVIMAVSLGLAMMTKLNSVLIAPAIAALFIYELTCNEKKGSLIKQYLLFLLFSVPFGIYWPVRNLIRFDVPLTYVQTLPVPNPQTILDTPLLARILIPDISSLTHAFQMGDPTSEYNVFVELIRTSLFDEYYIAGGLPVLFETVLFIASIIIAIWMFVRLAVSIIEKDYFSVGQRLLLGAGWGAMILCFVIFCISNPYVCSQNYRYIPLAMLFPVIASGRCLSLKIENGKDQWILTVFKVLIILMVLTSFMLGIFGELPAQQQ